MHFRSGWYCPQRVYISMASPTVKIASPSQNIAITGSMPARNSSRRSSRRVFMAYLVRGIDRTVMPRSWMPACLQAVSTEATFWNSPRASPRTSTPRSLYCRRAAANRVVSCSSVTGALSKVIVPSR